MLLSRKGERNAPPLSMRAPFFLARQARGGTLGILSLSVIIRCGTRSDLPAPSSVVPPLCSQTLDGPTLMTGGQMLHPRSATMYADGSVEIADHPDICALDDQAGPWPPDGVELQLSFMRRGPGRFTVKPYLSDEDALRGRLVFYFDRKTVFQSIAVAGTVDVLVDDLAPCGPRTPCVPCDVDIRRKGRKAGHYDLTFPDGAHAVGDFDAPQCMSARDCVYGGDPNCR